MNGDDINTSLIEKIIWGLAVIKCSICTGEQVAGFKSKEDGHFTEVMLIRDAKDLEMFKKMYKVTEIKKEY